MKSYEAQLFVASQDGDRAGRTVGTVTVREGALCFVASEAGDRSARLPLSGLECRSGGLEHENLFFSSSMVPGLELMVDRDIGEAPELAGMEGVARAVRRRRLVRLRYFGVVGCGYLLVAIVVVGGLFIAGMVLEEPLRWLWDRL